ncbi:MAG: hypothetical protein WCN92_08710 [Eubacteriales bacterium]
MVLQDDSDVKIFGNKAGTTDAGDLAEVSSQLDRHRSNGNIAKAKALGERLAVLEPESSSGIDLYDLFGEADVPPAEVYQIRVLLVFVAQTTISKRLVTPLLSSCAVNAMYNKLMETSTDFYTDISDGAAFTFYSLSLRRDKDIPKSIGEYFAMLCGRENNKVYEDMGADVYTHAVELIEGIIGEYCFEELV